MWHWVNNLESCIEMALCMLLEKQLILWGDIDEVGTDVDCTFESELICFVLIVIT